MKDRQPPDPYNVNVGGVRLDPYIIAEAFALPPTIAEALKKLLRLGRKHKTAREDAEECIKTVRRWLEIQDVLLRGDGKPGAVPETKQDGQRDVGDSTIANAASQGVPEAGTATHQLRTVAIDLHYANAVTCDAKCERCLTIHKGLPRDRLDQFACAMLGKMGPCGGKLQPNTKASDAP